MPIACLLVLVLTACTNSCSASCPPSGGDWQGRRALSPADHFPGIFANNQVEGHLYELVAEAELLGIIDEQPR